MCAQMPESDGKIATSVDESTTLSNESTVRIYLKCDTLKDDYPHFMFLDLIALPRQTASGTVDCELKCLNKSNSDYNYSCSICEWWC